MSYGLNKTFWNSETRAASSSFLAKERKGGKVRKKDQGKRRRGRGRKGENRN